MKILFGHPTGNPNSHHAALAHLEAGQLAGFCVPWMPSFATLNLLKRIPGIAGSANRLERRYFAPLAGAPLIQGKLGEISRMLRRQFGSSRSEEGLSYEANDWLMSTMAKACVKNSVDAVHSYEDCSLLQFQRAKELGKICIYDMPIGYYPWWESKQIELNRQFSDWLPQPTVSMRSYVRPEQKKEEMELADLVIVPGSFVERTIREFLPHKAISLAPYGVDTEFWCPRQEDEPGDSASDSGGEPSQRGGLNRPLRFLFAGQVGIRKGIPSLLQAWQLANLKESQLDLVGNWSLSSDCRKRLPQGVHYHGPCSRSSLRNHYQNADVFVFPSFFEGFGLVLLEAMSCGLPAIASDATAGPDVLTAATGKVFPAGDVPALMESLHWFEENRDQLPEMKRQARLAAEQCTWGRYRQAVIDAVGTL